MSFSRDMVWYIVQIANKTTVFCVFKVKMEGCVISDSWISASLQDWQRSTRVNQRTVLL